MSNDTHDQHHFDYRALWSADEAQNVIFSHNNKRAGIPIHHDGIVAPVETFIEAVAHFDANHGIIIGEESADFTPHALSHHHNDNTVQLHHGEKPTVIIPAGHDPW